jgi:catechol 2,3-dioxygenase-like lactoylglutathione lyase family enzyme
MTLTVQALDHLVVQVSNLEVSARWYERVLGMTREDVSPAPGQPPRTEMKFGRQKINLRPIATSKEDWFTADHEAAGSEDLCFLTDSSPDEVVRHLAGSGRRNRRRPRAKTGRAGNAGVDLLPRSGRRSH